MLHELTKLMALSPYFASDLREKKGSNFLTMNSLFAVEFGNNLLSPYFDSNTTAVISKTESFCDGDIVLVKIKDAPVCFRQVFVGENGIYFSVLDIQSERKTALTQHYTIIGIVTKSIKKLK